MVPIRQEIIDLMSSGADVAPENFIPAMRGLIDQLGQLNQLSAKPSTPFKTRMFAGIEHGVFGDEAQASGVIFHVHGGGFVAGGVESHRHLFEFLAREHGFLVVAPDYPLAPENGYQRILGTIKDAFLATTAEYAPHLPIFLTGDSAGGALALSTALALRAEHGPMPLAIATFSAVTDLALRSPSLASCKRKDIMISQELLEPLYGLFAPGPERASWQCSPIEAPRVDLPPLLMQVGSDEVLRDDSTRFVDLAMQGGTQAVLEVWPDMFHVWQNFPTRLPEARQALTRVADFFRKASAGLQ